MEMHQVRYFLAVCEHLNFTRAAESCHVAQPSLTRAIKLLEEELGGPLFHRERANTHLSELGLMVRPHLQEVYVRARAVKQQAIDFSQLRRATLRLGVMCTIAPTHPVTLLTGLRARHPGIEIEFVGGTAGELEKQLKSGDLDVAIYSDPSGGGDEGLHRQVLFHE